MEPFRDNVFYFYLLLWRAILAALIGLVSMATCRLGPAAASSERPFSASTVPGRLDQFSY